MTDLTITVPAVGTKAIFTFKEPFESFVKNKFRYNIDNTRMEVISVLSMKDNVINDARDPYSQIYDPAGISQDRYKKDVIDDIPIVTLRFKDSKKVTKYIRVPANYIADISDSGTVDYISKMLVIDLGMLPVDLDVAKLTTALREEVSNYTGVDGGGLPSIHEVALGDIEVIPYDDHLNRETIRNNLIDHEENLVKQAEYWEARFNSLIDLLSAKNIRVNLDDII